MVDRDCRDAHPASARFIEGLGGVAEGFRWHHHRRTDNEGRSRKGCHDGTAKGNGRQKFRPLLVSGIASIKTHVGGIAKKYEAS